MLQELNKLTGGINTSKESIRKPDEFADIVNMYYNARGALETRRGTRTFANQVGSKPFTSLFFFQRDDTGVRILLGVAGDVMYKYDEPNDEWDSIKTGLTEFEADGVTRTKWSFCVYKNIIYACDWVNPYMSIDGTTVTQALSSGVSVTLDHTTDIITHTAHWFVEGDRVALFWTLPSEITQGRMYFVRTITTDTYQISLKESSDIITFTSNGSWVTDKRATTPLFRYLQYMGDRVFGAGDDYAPITVFFTNAVPADAASFPPANYFDVGSDELWKINALKELWTFICVWKDRKIYSLDVATESAVPIDSGSWIRSHRSMQNVEGSIILFNESGLDTLRQTSAVSGTQALGTKVLSDKIQEYFNTVQPVSYKRNASLYAPLLNNYYFSFDRNNVGTTDTTVVYSSNYGAFTRYEYPSIYDYVTYIDQNGNYKYLFAPSTGGQVYEMEYGYDDAGVPIEWMCDYKTKFGTDDFKTISWVQVRWRKSRASNPTLTINIDGYDVSSCEISDDFINENISPFPVGVSPIWIYSLGGGDIVWNTIDTFEFSIRLPIEQTGQELSIKIEWNETPLVFSLEQMRVDVNKEVISLFDNYG